jgi:hypothetical protein
MSSQKDETSFCRYPRSIPPEWLAYGVSILMLIFLASVLGAQLGPADYERALIRKRSFAHPNMALYRKLGRIVARQLITQKESQYLVPTSLRPESEGEWHLQQQERPRD